MTSSTLLTDPLLVRLRAEANETVKQSRALVANLTPEQLSWRPGPRRWSIAHCFSHLVAIGELYHPRFQKAIERTRAAGAAPKGAPRPFRPSWVGRVFLFLSGPSRIPVPAPPRLRPLAEADLAGPTKFFAQQEELIALLEAADGLDLTHERVGSPVTRRVRLTLAEGLAMIVGHQRRHLEQARRVIATRGFPRS